MFQNYKSTFSMSQCVGIEITQVEDTLQYHAVLLSLEKGQVHTLSIAEHIDFQALQDFVPSGVPAYIACSQLGVLYKTLPHQPSDATAALAAVFPSATASDFFTTIFPTASGSIVGVMRQTALEETLATFQNANIGVTHVTLGAFHVELLQPYLTEKETILTASTTLEFEDSQLIQAIPHDSTTHPEIPVYQLGDERVSGNLLVAYAAAFNGLMVQTPMPSVPTILEQNQQEFRYKSWFELVGKVGLSILLIALLANFILFTNYTQANQTQSLQLAAQQHTIQQLDSLRSEVQRKRSFFQNNTLSQPSTTSRYADAIAQTLPNALQLTSLHIFPSEKQERSIEEALPRFKNSSIAIKGTTKASFAFNTWKKELADLSWVKSVSIVQYQEVNGVGEFDVLVEVE